MTESYLFGVFDGHGVNGHHVSDFVKRNFPGNLSEAYLNPLTMEVGNRNRSLLASQNVKRRSMNLLSERTPYSPLKKVPAKNNEVSND